MNVVKLIADMMGVAARTAPKTKGEDFVAIEVIEGDAVAKLADAMDAYGKEAGKRNFDRDARGVRESPAVVLIGIKDATRVGLNCGACGWSECAKMPDPVEGPEFSGPHCAYRLLDMGIALGSAAKTAGLHSVDSRMMYRAGVAARRLGLIDADVVIGLPISATGKNIYFDRKS